MRARAMVRAKAMVRATVRARALGDTVLVVQVDGQLICLWELVGVGKQQVSDSKPKRKVVLHGDEYYCFRAS